jgi:hypothetical protein
MDMRSLILILFLFLCVSPYCQEHIVMAYIECVTAEYDKFVCVFSIEEWEEYKDKEFSVVYYEEIHDGGIFQVGGDGVEKWRVRKRNKEYDIIYHPDLD